MKSDNNYYNPDEKIHQLFLSKIDFADQETLHFIILNFFELREMELFEKILEKEIDFEAPFEIGNSKSVLQKIKETHPWPQGMECIIKYMALNEQQQQNQNLEQAPISKNSPRL